jgi:alanine dehydrogenase
MRIGVPKEIKVHEYRVGLTPTAVREIIHHGHEVVIESRAGHGIGFDDEHYAMHGAKIVPSASDVFGTADLIIKVKEPQPPEIKLLRPGQVIFTYLHLAPDPAQAKGLQAADCVAIAYETVTDREGRLPLLGPMSEVAGRMSIQVGAHYLEKGAGGRGVLLGGVPGVPAANVVIIGGGVVGTNAARMAMGFEARVIVIDKSISRLYALDLQFGARLNTIFSTVDAIEQYVCDADLVVGAVLVPGAAAPRLVTEAMIKRMRRGSVFVDVAIDQGGCSETSRPTTHADPVYVVGDVIHYCVTNMPGAVARTSTLALNNATLPFVLALADKGYRRAMAEDPHLKAGLNVHRGAITHPAVAEALGTAYTAPDQVLGR